MAPWAQPTMLPNNATKIVQPPIEISHSFANSQSYPDFHVPTPRDIHEISTTLNQHCVIPRNRSMPTKQLLHVKFQLDVANTTYAPSDDHWIFEYPTIFLHLKPYATSCSLPTLNPILFDSSPIPCTLDFMPKDTTHYLLQ